MYNFPGRGRDDSNRSKGKSYPKANTYMARIGTRAEVWFSNVIAAFARYVAERVLPESVPMLMRRDAIMDSFNYAKETMKDAYSFLDRFEGLSLSIVEARRRFPSRKQVLEFGVYKGGMINYQAKKFPDLNFTGFDSFEGLQEQWSGMAPEGPTQCRADQRLVCRNSTALEGEKSRLRRAIAGAHRL
jgi:hypothetical protein